MVMNCINNFIMQENIGQLAALVPQVILEDWDVFASKSPSTPFVKVFSPSGDEDPIYLRIRMLSLLRALIHLS